MIRVLHVVSGNIYGGVETSLVTLARERHRCPDMEPHFAVCFLGRLADELTATGAPVHMLGEARVRRPLSVWRARRRLASLLPAAAIDVVTCHAPWTHALFGRVPRAAGRPLVLWLHAPFLGRHWLERWAHHTPPDALISNSRFTAAASAGAFANVPTDVVYFPVSVPEVGLGVAQRHAIRAELDTTADATVIVQPCLEKLVATDERSRKFVAANLPIERLQYCGPERRALVRRAWSIVSAGIGLRSRDCSLSRGRPEIAH